MLQHIELSDCPMCVVTPRSIEILEDYSRARLAHKAFGVAHSGPDLREWPARQVDAVNVIEREALEVEEALDSAMRDEMKDR